MLNNCAQQEQLRPLVYTLEARVRRALSCFELIVRAKESCERFWGESAGVVTVSGVMMVNLWLYTVWLRWGIRSSL